MSSIPNIVSNSFYVTNNDEDATPPISDSYYFQPAKIDRSRWSQFYPYELMLLVATNTSTTQAVDVGNQNSSYSKIASFVLPISPQELTIDMGFASSVQASVSGGVIEQHSGAPFRDIVLSGTTGLTPVKNQATGKDPIDNSFFSSTGPSLFGGALANATAVVNSASTLVGLNFFNSNVNQDIGTDLTNNNFIPDKSTGYYQFRLLQKFLEFYAEVKRKSTDIVTAVGTINSKDIRLAFGIWKDEAVYLVTGTRFLMKRSQANPMEYMYTFQAKAWKRINPSYVGVANSFQKLQLPAQNPSFFASLLTRMSLVSDILQESQQTIQSLVQDPLDDLQEIQRQTLLYLKTGAGITNAVIDFPTSIKLEIMPFLVQSWSTIRANLQDFPSNPPAQYVSSPNSLFGVTGITNTSPSYTPTSIVTNLQATQYLSQINPNKLSLPPTIIADIKNEISRVQAFTRQDFDDMSQRITQLVSNLNDTIGLGGDSNFNLIYNHQVLPQVHTAEPTELDVMYSLNELSLTLKHLAASQTINPPTPSSIEYVAGLAQKSGIAFQIPLSKFSTPFPYGTTLENLSATYLGTPDRWHEIATLNGLRAPYVDEQGFQLPFQVNGVDNSLYVNDNTNLYVGQFVYISAINIPRNSRRIVNIIKVYDGYYQIIVNGNDDLGNYLILNNAILEAFLPGTVNSQQLIYIPSNKASGTDLRTIDIPGVNIYDPLLQVGGTDLLLTQSMDLALDPGGDVKISYGLQNIIQTIQLALSTPQGSLLHHPEYGLPLTVGQSLADMNSQDLANAIKNMFSGDPTFTSVSNVTIDTNAPGTNISMSINIAGVSDIVPLTFSINQ
jgi:hypothetical protein